MAGLIKGFGLLADAGGYISSKAKDLIDEISEFADVDSNGMVSVFHRTSKENADKIRESGIFTPKEDGIFFSTKRGGANSDGYGDEVIELKIPADKLELDDIFDGEAHLRLPAKANKPNDVSEFIPNKPLPEPSGLLDMSTPARMSRADDMGFDTNTTYYHGTDEDFDAFDPQSVGSNFGFDKKGFFFTTSKDSANRSRKSYPSGSKYTYTDEQKKAAAGGRVIGTHLKLNNPLTRKDIEGFDSGGGGQSPIALYDLNRAKIEKALESGQYDGVKIKAEGQTMVTVLEPSQIRSTDATFDPAKASSSNLLASNPAAGATAAGMGLIAMGASDDSEAGVVSSAAKVGKGLLDFPNQITRDSNASLLNFNDDAFHGSTYDISDFSDAGTLNPEGHFGAAHYFTSSADDASRNYAGLGPDLTQRVQQRAEQLEGDLDGYGVDDLMGSYPNMTRPEAESIAGGDSELFSDVMKRIATKELVGDNAGVMYPVKLRRGNAFDISSDGDTFLRYEHDVQSRDDFISDARNEFDVKDFDNADEFEVAVEDLADEMYDDAINTTEPEGALVDFVDSFRSQASEYNVDDESVNDIVGAIHELAYMDGGMSGKDLDHLMRNTEWYADNDTGKMINNEVYRKAIEDSGFNSIVHDGNIFKGMEIDPDTRHTIMFSPKDIRSTNAKFDPANSQSSNILASKPAATIGAGILGAIGASQSGKTYADYSPSNLARLQNDDVGGYQAPFSGLLARAAMGANSLNDRGVDDPLMQFVAPRLPSELMGKIAYNDKRGASDYLKAAAGLLGLY